EEELDHLIICGRKLEAVYAHGAVLKLEAEIGIAAHADRRLKVLRVIQAENIDHYAAIIQGSPQDIHHLKAHCRSRHFVSYGCPPAAAATGANAWFTVLSAWAQMVNVGFAAKGPGIAAPSTT